MSEFASVLRSWRDRVSPDDVGLPSSPRRRTTGLRREELAALAQVSVDYIVRLEQGRASNPSPQMLRALSVALRLTDDERDHLYRSAGAAPPSPGTVPRHIGPGVQRIVDRLGDVPLAVFSATHDILSWNPMWAAVNGDPSSLVGLDRNLVWRHFTSGHAGTEFDQQHEEDFASDLAADLRAAVGRYPDDASLAHLVSRLLSSSPEFERRWAEAKVADHRASRKTVTDTPVGPLTIDCDVLSAPGDLRIVVYTVAPGSIDQERLDLLRVTGLQTLAAPPAG
ncbi:helix-turn-helix transcriptional regulator [Frigoribacterium faeni]|uniref:Transcriptional regulator n=1 Tax=Frigoribacterium faeni TaxID=145483 RepID=A0A7W3JFG6_9MICO|nr:helix-turn-helix transcriptional regulator [Frigoribacterium faeni]MBA8811907.1 transcriptional regulator with XRE-family HTH domain [Frigoribacterium faeni]BFF12891.1 helix-turn-helix transcriptional regulator [Microbacterium flavescens]GEK84643.1 transcriptional regulator [Frigoribacterium faeni]